MKILAIVGSMRKNGQTNRVVSWVLDEISALVPEVQTDILFAADWAVQPCRVVCSEYCSTHPFRCSIRDDLAGIFERMAAADALLIGTPLYFRGPPAKMQALVERLVSVAFFLESRDETALSPVAGKPCGLIGTAEYSNPHQILEYLADFCMVLKMRPVLLDRFPYLGVAGQGDAGCDESFYPIKRSRELAQALVAAIQGL